MVRTRVRWLRDADEEAHAQQILDEEWLLAPTSDSRRIWSIAIGFVVILAACAGALLYYLAGDANLTSAVMRSTHTSATLRGNARVRVAQAQAAAQILAPRANPLASSVHDDTLTPGGLKRIPERVTRIPVTPTVPVDSLPVRYPHSLSQWRAEQIAARCHTHADASFPLEWSSELCAEVWSHAAAPSSTSANGGAPATEEGADLLMVVVDSAYSAIMLNSVLSLVLARCHSYASLHATTVDECVSRAVASHAAWSAGAGDVDAEGRVNPAATLLSGYLVVSLSDECHAYFLAHGVPSVLMSRFPLPPMTLFDPTSSGGAVDAVVDLRRVYISRWWVMWCMLDMGLHVFHSDADIMYRHDPYAYIDAHTFTEGDAREYAQAEHIVAPHATESISTAALNASTISSPTPSRIRQYDVHSGSGVYPEHLGAYFGGSTLQGGFLRVRNTRRSLAYVRAVVHAGFASVSKDDQVAANTVAVAWTTSKGADGGEGAGELIRAPCINSVRMGQCANYHIGTRSSQVHSGAAHPSDSRSPPPASVPTGPATLSLSFHLMDSHSFLTGGTHYAEAERAECSLRPDAAVVHPTGIGKEREAKTTWLKQKGYWILPDEADVEAAIRAVHASHAMQSAADAAATATTVDIRASSASTSDSASLPSPAALFLGILSTLPDESLPIAIFADRHECT
jgi:hypothetical protein